jgi:hypothetical protein
MAKDYLNIDLYVGDEVLFICKSTALGLHKGVIKKLLLNKAVIEYTDVCGGYSESYQFYDQIIKITKP